MTSDKYDEAVNKVLNLVNSITSKFNRIAEIVRGGCYSHSDECIRYHGWGYNDRCDCEVAELKELLGIKDDI